MLLVFYTIILLISAIRVDMLYMHRLCTFSSGLGLAVAKRLFEEAGHAYQLTDLRVCLACRNLQKAKFAKQELHEIFGLDIQVDVLELDVSRPASVKQAVEEIKCRSVEQT